MSQLAVVAEAHFAIWQIAAKVGSAIRLVGRHTALTVQGLSRQRFGVLKPALQCRRVTIARESGRSHDIPWTLDMCHVIPGHVRHIS